jgi:apolipoprotein N-acyltransferase
MIKILRKTKPIYFLLSGVILLALAHMTHNIGFLAWFAYTPFLIYLYRTDSRWKRFYVLVALIAGWSLVVAKIISPPLIYGFVFMYSIPIALVHFPAFLLWDRFKQHRWAYLLFPATLTVLEWVQYTFTPLASWGVAAYSQSEYLATIQSLSLFGMPGLSFLIYWVNVALADAFVRETKLLKPLRLPIALLILIVGFGEMRLNLANASGKDVLNVAAIGTDSKASGLPFPVGNELKQINDQLFERTKNAAAAGARIVVWNEGATFILPVEEPGWKQSLQQLAKESEVFLFASYIKPTSTDPLRYDNKYIFVNDNGMTLYEYHKHEPVPGEPAVKGKETIKTFLIADARVGGAICYDYDFPYLAAMFGNAQADIMALPSSDWRGIDPVHTEMAAFRAIEQGHSIIRSTRFGLSAAINPYGEMVAKMSSFDDNNKIMLATLPKKGITTLYSVLGDLFVYLLVAFVLVFVSLKIFKGTKTP